MLKKIYFIIFKGIIIMCYNIFEKINYYSEYIINISTLKK